MGSKTGGGKWCYRLATSAATGGRVLLWRTCIATGGVPRALLGWR